MKACCRLTWTPVVPCPVHRETRTPANTRIAYIAPCSFPVLGSHFALFRFLCSLPLVDLSSAYCRLVGRKKKGGKPRDSTRYSLLRIHFFFFPPAPLSPTLASGFTSSCAWCTCSWSTARRRTSAATTGRRRTTPPSPTATTNSTPGTAPRRRRTEGGEASGGARPRRLDVTT